MARKQKLTYQRLHRVLDQRREPELFDEPEPDELPADWFDDDRDHPPPECDQCRHEEFRDK